MTKLFLIFSHTLTIEQVQEAKLILGVEEIIYLPEELQKKWSNIPTAGEIPDNYLEDIQEFLLKNCECKNYVLVQGDYGVSYIMVNWCFEKGFIPIYSTTEREYEKVINNDNSIVNKHVFKHVRFRKYER